MHIADFLQNRKMMLYFFSELKYNPIIKSPPQKKGLEIMKKIIALVLTLVLVAACFAGCGGKKDSDLAYVKKNGKLIVGITDYEPMDYKDENGNWTGFDAEFAQLVAKELGVEVEFFVLSDWGQKFYELETKNIDAVWNGMTITEEAKLNASVSDAYVINAQVVVMKADVVGDYTTEESLKSLFFAVESGSAGEEALQGIGITEYVAVQDQTSAVMEVAAGTADACVIDITMANAMTGPGTSYDDLAVGMALTSEEYGIAFRKDSDLTAKVNEIMKKLIEDGTLPALAEKYSLTLAG